MTTTDHAPARVAGVAQRLTEIGRIRLGEKTANGLPTSIDTFRLTSPDRQVIEQAAALWGGEVKPWEGEWEVITTVDSLPVLLPPVPDPWTQHNEQWTGGGCTHRCDGRTCERTAPTGRKIREGNKEYDEWATTLVPCECDPDEPVCKLTTRVKLLLPDLPGLAVWRLETHGRTAAQTLPGSIDFLRQVMGQELVPCRLRITKRTSKRLGAPTRNFVVPELICDVPLRQLVEQAHLVAGGQPARAMLTPSTSTEGVEYQLVQHDNGAWSCSCQGFTFHGHCKHAEAAYDGADPTTGEIVHEQQPEPATEDAAMDAAKRDLDAAIDASGLPRAEAGRVIRSIVGSTKRAMLDRARVDEAIRELGRLAATGEELGIMEDEAADTGGSAPGVDPDQAGGVA